VDRQPADGEYDHDEHDHPGHSALRLRPYDRLRRGPSEIPAAQEAPQHEPVQHADRGQRHDVREGEECCVEHLSVRHGAHRVVVVDVHVDALRPALVVERVLDDAVLERDVGIEETDQRPQDSYCQAGTADGAYRHGLDGVDDSEVAVEGHEDQGVDARVGGHVDDVLVELTPGVAERPC